MQKSHNDVEISTKVIGSKTPGARPEKRTGDIISRKGPPGHPQDTGDDPVQLSQTVEKSLRCDGPCGRVVWKGRAGERAWGAHQKTWRAARVMARESGAAPSAPMWHPAPRGGGLQQPMVAALAGHPAPGWTGVAAGLRGRRAASRAPGQPPGAGLGRRPEARGTVGCGEALAGMPREKELYISYTRH